MRAGSSRPGWSASPATDRPPLLIGAPTDTDLQIASRAGDNFGMATPSYLRLTKSETRDLADREYRARLLGKTEEWHLGTSAFFTAFVVITALLATLALLLR